MTTVTITPVSAWTTPLTTTAVNGQASDATTDFVAPIQVLANRVEYLKDTLQGVLPHSASTFSPVALYQLNGTLNATVGSNLTLTAGTAQYAKVQKLHGFWFSRVTDEPLLATAAAVPALAVTGAITVEFICLLSVWTGNLVYYGIPGGSAPGSESENRLWSLEKTLIDPSTAKITDGITARWNYGAGSSDETVAMVGGGFGSMLDSLAHVAWTRSSDGLTNKLYVNGRLVKTTSASNAPTGGGSSSCRLNVWGPTGISYSDAVGFMASLKICASELSAANILTEYEYCFGNVHGTL